METELRLIHNCLGYELFKHFHIVFGAHGWHLCCECFETVLHKRSRLTISFLDGDVVFSNIAPYSHVKELVKEVGGYTDHAQCWAMKFSMGDPDLQSLLHFKTREVFDVLGIEH